MVIVSLERNIQNIKELTDILQSPGLRKLDGFTISKSEKNQLQSVALDLVAVLENIPDHPEGGE